MIIIKKFYDGVACEKSGGDGSINSNPHPGDNIKHLTIDKIYLSHQKEVDKLEILITQAYIDWGKERPEDENFSNCSYMIIERMVNSGYAISPLFQKINPDDSDYPGKQYQRLFYAISDTNKIPLVSEMQKIISIVHEDFPKDDSEKDYWQKRCEAAEKVINALLNNSDTDENIQEYSEWQQLKSLPVK